MTVKKTSKKVFSGFTLIEIMVAMGLFIVLAISAYIFLKNLTEATLAGKVQQDAQNKAAAIINAITTDLKSSESARLFNGAANREDITSVLFPELFKINTRTDATNTRVNPTVTAPPEFPKEINENIAHPEAITRNQNRIIFYSKTSDNHSIIIEYTVVRSETMEGNSCRLERRVYRWNPAIANFGLTENGNAYLLSDVDFKERDASRQTIAEMQNPGDAIILYTSRSLVPDPFDHTAANTVSNDQYFIRVIVCEQIKRPQGNITGIYENVGADGDGSPIRYSGNFTAIFSNGKTAQRKNYRIASMDSVVKVPTRFHF